METQKVNPQRPGIIHDDFLEEALLSIYHDKQDAVIWFRCPETFCVAPVEELPDGVEPWGWFSILLSDSVFDWFDELSERLMAHGFRLRDQRRYPV